MSKHNRERRHRKEHIAGGNHLGKALGDMLQGLDDGSIKAGNCYITTIRHDDWCALLKETGPCNCEPEVLPPKLVPAHEEEN